MKRRLLAIAMTLAMALSLLPVTALAEGETITGETTSLQEGTYTLSGDVTLSGKLTVPADVTATIDLNGQTLTATKGIAISGALTIKDSGSVGRLTGETDVVTINSGAALTLEGGIVEATGKTAIKLAYNSTVKFTMTGGIVKGTGNTINAMMGTVTITGGRVETSSTATSSYAIYNNYGKTSITIGDEKGLFFLLHLVRFQTS